MADTICSILYFGLAGAPGTDNSSALKDELPWFVNNAVTVAGAVAVGCTTVKPSV